MSQHCTTSATRIVVAIGSGSLPLPQKRYTLTCRGTQVDATCQPGEQPGQVIFALDAPLSFDQREDPLTILDGTLVHSSATLVDILEDPDYQTRNIRQTAGRLTSAQRQALTGHRGLVVWMTGLSGSGKSTIAQQVEKRLLASGIPAYLLDGDRLRTGLNADLGFSDAHRTENQRRVAEVAALFRDAGLVTLVATISPRQSHRDLAREKAGGDFLEVYVRADYATCQQRDPKKLYEKADAGDIANFTGKGSVYQVPAAPDLTLDTMTHTAQQCIDLLMDRILQTINHR